MVLVDDVVEVATLAQVNGLGEHLLSLKLSDCFWGFVAKSEGDTNLLG